MLSLLYGPTLTYIHDYWKNYTLLFRHLSAEWRLCFLEHCLGFHSFSSEDQTSFNFMAAVTIGSDFGAQESKSATVSIFSLFAMKWWDQMPWSLFFECWVLSQLFHSPLSMSGSHCYFLTCIQVSQKAGKVVWYSHLFNNFLVCCNSHSERLWCNQWSRNRCFFWNSLSFSMIQCMLAIWSVVPLPFLNLACTSGSSWFMYCSCTVQA